MTFKCPVCKKVVKPPEKSGAKKERFFPFCSERCKLIDLGAWLDAEYRVSGEDQAGGFDEDEF